MLFNDSVINHKALDYKLCPLPLNADGMKWMDEQTFQKQTKLWVPIKYHNPDFLKWTMNIGLSITDIELLRDINTADLYWYPDEVDLIESHDIKVSIVQVGQPHNVATTHSSRKCLSCVFDKILSSGYTTNDQIILNEELSKIAFDRDKAVKSGILQDVVPMWDAVNLFKRFII